MIENIKTAFSDNKKSEFRYLQLKDWIISEIKRKKLISGNKIASQRELMNKYSLSYSTVSTALRELVAEGYLIRKAGNGTYVGSLHRTATICLAHPMLTNEEFIQHGAVIELLEGIQYQIHKLDWSLMLAAYEPGRSSPPKILSHNMIDGLILVFGIDKSTMNFIRELKPLPIVIAGNYIEGEDFPAVIPDFAMGMRQSLDCLMQLGHRKIGKLQLHNSGHAGVNECVQAYCQYMQETGNYNSNLIVESNNEANAFKAIWPKLKDMTAVCVQGDVFALQFIDALREAGIRVPEDISVTGFDDLPIARQRHPQLTTVGFDRPLIGRLAVDRLENMILGGKEETGVQRVSTELRIRGTVCKCRH